MQQVQQDLVYSTSKIIFVSFLLFSTSFGTAFVADFQSLSSACLEIMAPPSAITSQVTVTVGEEEESLLLEICVSPKSPPSDYFHLLKWT